MSSVRKLASSGQRHTILATIHQPSPEVFALFDKVLLLSQGRQVYYGPVSTCTKYFTSPPLCKYIHPNR
jgi:ABC-type multidrug transport system ATPase subunit